MGQKKEKAQHRTWRGLNPQPQESIAPQIAPFQQKNVFLAFKVRFRSYNAASIHRSTKFCSASPRKGFEMSKYPPALKETHSEKEDEEEKLAFIQSLFT